MMTPSRGLLLPCIALAAALLLPACVGPALPLATSADDIAPGETIVVGKIVISPPVDETEQTLKTVNATNGGIMINPSAEEYKNKIVLLTDNKLRRIEDPGISDYRGRIEAPLGQTFYARAQNSGPLYVNRSEIMMSLNRSGMEKAVLPSGYKINIRPGDKAVYIGTIKYHRDEFFEVHKIEIIDDYEKESAAFRKKFGKKIALRKAIITGAEKSASRQQ